MTVTQFADLRDFLTRAEPGDHYTDRESTRSVTTYVFTERHTDPRALGAHGGAVGGEAKQLTTRHYGKSAYMGQPERVYQSTLHAGGVYATPHGVRHVMAVGAPSTGVGEDVPAARVSRNTLHKLHEAAIKAAFPALTSAS